MVSKLFIEPKAQITDKQSLSDLSCLLCGVLIILRYLIKVLKAWVFKVSLCRRHLSRHFYFAPDERVTPRNSRKTVARSSHSRGITGYQGTHALSIFPFILSQTKILYQRPHNIVAIVPIAKKD